MIAELASLIAPVSPLLGMAGGVISKIAGGNQARKDAQMTTSRSTKRDVKEDHKSAFEMKVDTEAGVKAHYRYKMLRSAQRILITTTLCGAFVTSMFVDIPDTARLAVMNMLGTVVGFLFSERAMDATK